MQTSFTNLDHQRISWVFAECIKKLLFLSKMSKEDGTSSELKGYEINKLLTEQLKLEENYAELLKVRTTLKGISDKRKLEEIQKEIQDVALLLKENTRKLGRLFRENPSFEKDAEKIITEKTSLLEKLGGILNTQTANFSVINLQTGLIDELESQDSLRKCTIQEKTLVQDIKQIHGLYKKEEDEYQNIMVEKQAHIQRMKEELARQRASANMETNYKTNELSSFEGTLNRNQNQRLTDLQKAIEDAENKKHIEVQAFNKIRAFLKNKEDQMKEKTAEWSDKVEDHRVVLETKIEDLNNRKEKALAKLQKLKEDFEVADGKRQEKEKIYLEKEAEKQRKLEYEEKLEGAVKAIQENYLAWKEAGGGVTKKSKKSKGEKKSKK